MIRSIGRSRWHRLAPGLLLVCFLGCSIGCQVPGVESMAASDVAVAGYLGEPPREGLAMDRAFAPTESSDNENSMAPARPLRDDDGAPSGKDGGPPARLMIYEAWLSLQVSHSDEAAERFLAQVESKGGYLQRKVGESIVCRVPAREFEPLLEVARRLGRLIGEKVEATDVTRQHRDIRIRLENALQSRGRLLAILERATEVEDILKIETELRRLSEEIERYQAELRGLDDLIAFSTIELQFVAPPVVRSRARIAPSRFDWINRVGLERIHRGF